MSESTTALTSSANGYAAGEFWERLSRTAGLQFVAFYHGACGMVTTGDIV